MSHEHSYAVILAGGGGTRLWPKSRKKKPKHLLSLFGKETMLQMTYNRALQIFPKDHIFIITLKDHLPDLEDQLPDVVKENIIAEPEPKNTALAMGVAAAFVFKKDPEGVIINFSADHIILDSAALKKDVLAALEAASEYKCITTIGIKPTFPHTGLGYIKMGEKIKDVEGVELFNGAGFKEKPNQELAQQFFESGNFLWNTGIYCWRADTFLDKLREHSPEISQYVGQVLVCIGQKDQLETIRQVYDTAPSQQIDTAVSEKVDRMILIPGSFDWSDVGDWKVVYDMQKKDTQGNAINSPKGGFIGIDNKNCLVESNGRLVVGIGLENLAIIDTEDTILIVNKDKTQDVKKVIEKLKEEGKDSYL